MKRCQVKDCEEWARYVMDVEVWDGLFKMTAELCEAHLLKGYHKTAVLNIQNIKEQHRITEGIV